MKFEILDFESPAAFAAPTPHAHASHIPNPNLKTFRVFRVIRGSHVGKSKIENTLTLACKHCGTKLQTTPTTFRSRNVQSVRSRTTFLLEIS